MTTYNTSRKKRFRCLFALVTAIVLTVPYVAFGAGPAFSRSGSSRASGMHGQPSFQTVFTALDFLMGMDSTIRAISRSSLFSRLSLHQPPNLALRRKTESTFSHTGWTAGMECRSCSQDTGPPRRKRIDPLNLHGAVDANAGIDPF